MTNLYPGMLFYSSGLNRKSTPIRPEATPSEIEHKLGRAPFNGRPWPKSSPVSHVYDVRNSSTRMIILNNKLSKKPKGSRLRGQTDHKGEIEHPEPFRHISDEPHTNWHHHKKCATSASERFVPIFPPGMSPPPAWVNKTQRPAMKFDNGSGVNPNHHIQCQGHMDYDIVRWYNRQRRPRSRTSTSTKDNRALSPILNDPNLSRGERRYLNHIAKIYSVDNMRVQKQLQYNELMWSEIRKGRIRQGDWEKYYKYLNTPRKTQFGPCDPTRNSRSISAPNRMKTDTDDESRPYTTQTGAKKSSRVSSRADSMRPLPERHCQRAPGQKQGSKPTRKIDALVGKPARVESPLLLVPRKNSVSSLSSLESDHERKEEGKQDLTSNDDAVTKPSKGRRASRESRSTDDSQRETQLKLADSGNKEKDDEAAREKYDDVDKRMEEDDDERSKMSARGSGLYEDSHDNSETYHPTFNERVEEEERSRNDTTPMESQASLKEEYKRKEEEKVVPEIVTLPPTKDKSDSDNNGSSDDSGKDATGKVDDSDDMDNGPQLIHHIHKEGEDRPLSRLGGRGQFTLIKKETALNSDDDYSDDDEDTPNKTEEQRGETLNDKAETGHPGKTEAKGSRISPQQSVEEMSVRVGLSKVDTTSDKVPPTVASSQEKPSTISTLEY